MTKREPNSIFKEVAQMAGDIVFCYDLTTKKFMQYSDKTELSKYGSWLYDFENAMVNSKMVFSEDTENFRALMRRVKNGDKGNIEGMFRMRLHVSGDYRWYHMLARAVRNGGEPTEVIGRITDIHAYYMMEYGRRSLKAAAKGNGEAFLDKDGFMDAIIRYTYEHKGTSMVGCILFDLPAYDSIIESLSREEAGEFRTNFLQCIKRSFPSDAVVGRVGIRRFGVFTGWLGMASGTGDSINQVKTALSGIGKSYNVVLEPSMGVCLEHSREGIETVIFERAQAALESANEKGPGSLVFFGGGREEARVITQAAPAEEANDLIVEYALKMLDGSADMRKDMDSHMAATIRMLAGKLGMRYGFERIAVSLCNNGSYKEYVHWCAGKINGLPEGSLLHIQGMQKKIEEKVTFWGPYVVDNVESYPDDSWYGRMVRFTAVKSLLQGGFECGNGIRGIISLEYYTQAHVWTKEEFEILDRTKYIADFCVKYAGR